jgi:hypothetical protein
MRLGDKCDFSAHPHARTVIHSREPPYIAALTPFLSHILLLKIRFERPVIPIKKAVNPFSDV